MLTSPFPGIELVSGDGIGATSVPGLYAAASLVQHLGTAAASRGTAGAMINRDLLMEDVA